MAYTKFHVDWKNRPNFSTPITAEAMEHIEEGIAEAHILADGAAKLPSGGTNGQFLAKSDTGLAWTNAPASQDLRAQLARNPDQLIAGTITRDANGTATSAPVVWPDGTPGTYTALAVSTEFPGAVDSYKVTYGNPVQKTYTQPSVTRDASGAATVCPPIEVS